MKEDKEPEIDEEDKEPEPQPEIVFTMPEGEFMNFGADFVKDIAQSVFLNT